MPQEIDPTVVTEADLAWLDRCVALATDARARTDHPFGSLIVTPRLGSSSSHAPTNVPRKTADSFRIKNPFIRGA